MLKVNHQILLASRPEGAVSFGHLRSGEVRLTPLADGQVRVRNHSLSLDPCVRGRMNDTKSYAAPSYAAPWGVGDVMGGGTVGVVKESRNPGWQVGDAVLARFGWQEYGTSDGTAMQKVDATRIPLSAYLGAVGMPGVTAWHGLNRICAPKPGETVAVSAASGAVGGVVGQLAKRHGCRVVGIAGYDGAPLTMANPALVLRSRRLLQGFVVSEHMEDWPAALAELGGLAKAGQLKIRESVADGLASAPDAFLGLLAGRNVGKQLVRLVGAAAAMPA